MEGIDEGWIQNNDLQTVRYFLPPGKYKFQMYASRSFDKDAKPMKEINITIHPPFWKTWWFITEMAILALLLVTLTVNQYIKSRYRKRLIMLEGENKIRIERERISRDLHDSLGAYANAVLYNTDLLQQKENAPQRDELIKDLRFAAKDIITALRETIWALKKDSYTAEECMLRIKNFIQPFSQYYRHLLFKFEGDVPEKKLQHNKAFHLVRIVQEAVSNAIKHADAKNIIITSSIENNYWKLVINDDGKGFDYTTTKEMQLGNGLNNMQQRAAEGKFDYSIYSIKNVGTTITITL
jgi:signal transduction histidine kinase